MTFYSNPKHRISILQKKRLIGSAATMYVLAGLIVVVLAMLPVPYAGSVVLTGVDTTESLKKTFHNPILDQNAADPFIYQHDDGYYYYSLTNTENTELYVYRSQILSDWRQAEKSTVYYIPLGWYSLWAPEIHYVQGHWYIYFTMDDGKVENHRMFVIRALDPSNPLGQYTAAIRMNPEDINEDYYAIDGTVMQYDDGNLYFLYSGGKVNASTWPQNIFITPMNNPTTVGGPRVLIREPTEDWEGGLNEGPQVIKKGNRTLVVISSRGPDYCLALMGIDDGRDPLVADNWWHNRDGCVFYRNKEEQVWAPGHASFVLSPDKTEWWMVYHAMQNEHGGWPNRTARAERFTWNEDDTPNFSRPSGLHRAHPLPSGEEHLMRNRLAL